MGTLSKYQLLVLTILFETGTKVIFGFASEAGRDAWISAILSMVLGLLLILIYLKLSNLMPELTIVEWYPKQFGKWIGVPVSWMYLLIILMSSGGTLEDLKYLITVTLLPKTPIVISLGMVCFIVAFAVSKGIETIGRLGELFLPTIFVLFILEVFLIFGSDILHINYLKPVLGQGVGNVAKTLPLGAFLSYGETLMFAMIWPLVKPRDKVSKTVIIATIITGLFITISNLLSILILGETTYVRSYFPLYTMISQIRIAHFIENLESINVLYFLSTTFFKLCIMIFAITRGAQILTASKSNKFFIIPIVLCTLFIGTKMSSNQTAHLKSISEPGILLNIFLYNLILPVILLITTIIRKKLSKKNND